MTNRKCFLAENIEFFKKDSPLLDDWDHTPVSKIVGSEDKGDLNIDMLHSLFYVGGAIDFTKNQLYEETPIRFMLLLDQSKDKISNSTPLLLSKKLNRDIKNYVYDNIRLETSVCNDFGFYMFVLGLGLGLHIEPLVEKYNFKELIIVEEEKDFIHHALSYNEFPLLKDKVKKGELRVKFILGENASSNVFFDFMSNISLSKSPLFLNSIVYSHYVSHNIVKTKNIIKEEAGMLMLTKGFIEDETLMLRNTTYNIVKNGIRFFNNKSKIYSSTPVFIVANGASLDAALPTIKKYQDDVVIIASGTALETLLNRGIKVDFFYFS